MANGSTSTQTGMIAGTKRSVLAGAAVLGVVALLAISERGSDRAASGAAMAQSAAPPAATQSIVTGTLPTADKLGTFTPDQVKALHGIIKDYLLANPEILADVSRELERKQAAEQAARAEKFLAENTAAVFRSSADFVLGNPKGDITVVEFFDYNCGWCKRAVADLMTLTKADPKVRVVLKEYPIFGGPPSVLAARAALASIRQGKYWEFHAALMREKQVTEANLFVVAERVGLNVARLKADMADPKIEQTIKQNVELGQGLGIEGTPGFLVDARVNVGYVPADGLRQMIGDIRKQGCKVC